MTKVLVTGMNSRACNPAKNRRDVMLSWLLAEVCRDLGFEVEHRNPTVREDYSDFDHIFLSLAPLHSLGSNRAYGALSAYLNGMRESKITLIIDDPQSQNVWNGVKTVYNDPKRLVKSFFNYKLEFDIANQPEWHEWLMSGVQMLHDYAWPATLFPAYPWADVQQLKRHLPNVVDAALFDPTSFLPNYVAEMTDAWPITFDKQQWVTETADEKWLAQQRTNFDIVRYGNPNKGFTRRPDDPGLVVSYVESWGVLDRGEDHGWWTSRLGYAAQARAVYCTKWQNVEALGEPFWPLPDEVESYTHDQRQQLAEAQGASVEACTSPRDVVRDTIRTLVGKGALTNA